MQQWQASQILYARLSGLAMHLRMTGCHEKGLQEKPGNRCPEQKLGSSEGQEVEGVF